METLDGRVVVNQQYFKKILIELEGNVEMKLNEKHIYIYICMYAYIFFG